MSYWRCKICDISVPSEYQKTQHLEGSKHAAKLRYSQDANKASYVARQTNKNNNLTSSGDPASNQSETVANNFSYQDSYSSSLISRSDDLSRRYTFTYARDTAAGITKAVSHLREYMKERIRTSAEIDLDPRTNRIHFIFPYNNDFMDLIKTYVQGRTWNPIYKRWEAPIESAGDVKVLCNELGIVLPKELDELQGHDREIVFTVTDGEERAEVDFIYDADVVQAVKKLSPVYRHYNDLGDRKFWTVDVTHLPDLVHHLSEDLKAPKIEKEFLDYLKEIDAKLRELEEQEGSASEFESDGPSPKKFKPNSAEVSKEVFEIDLTGDDDDIQRTIISIIDKTKSGNPVPEVNVSPSSATASPSISPVKRKFSELTTFSSDSVKLPIKPVATSVKVPMSFIPSFTLSEERSRSKSECEECGKPKKKNHLCRFYGHYRCGHCSNRWTSAYSWKGEKQECRECRTLTSAYQLDKLLKDGYIERGTGGEHEGALCSMCQKLGRPCKSMSV